jgi:cell division septation protein DedD
MNKKWGTSLAVIAMLGLSACDENGAFQMPEFGTTAQATDTNAAPAAPTGATVERDVEAPEVFQVTDNGLWDGRPSLGGVWVAHPDVADPERVIIRSEANGKFVIGALFRRERDNPGPAIQVSSDAAEELGLLAGSPTRLNVTALRREEGPAAPPAAATVDFDNPVEITAAPLDDPIAGAAAAIDAAEAAAPAAAPTPTPAPAPASAPSSLAKPFIQIGIFSVEANANRTADRLRGDGLSARILPGESSGKSFWRVTVGPAPNSADRAAVLAKVKALGFADAYFVTN